MSPRRRALMTSRRSSYAASDLLVEVFGEKGRHARAAVGVAELPRNAVVEIELTVAYSE